MIKITCDNCGLVFERKPCKVKIAEKHYCSKACRYVGQNAAKRILIIKDNDIYLEATKGNTAIFDLIDKDLAKFNWQSQKGYINRKDKYGRYVYMHQVTMERILGRSLNDNEEADHINGDRSDNRRKNLRLVTHLENCANIRKPNRINSNKSTSKYKGVSFDKTKNKFRARITSNGKTCHLGFFDDDKEAAREYDKAAISLFRENAKLNFPHEWYASEGHKNAGAACMAET
jgi:hypothetical protein